MFPEKLESTVLVEDPEAVEKEMRAGLRDLGPDKPFLAEEMPRRYVGSDMRITMRETGGLSNEDPWVEDLDVQFHDHDPRGWTEEQPWEKMRQRAEVRIAQTTFTNDDDQSLTSGGLNPKTIYELIRGAQDWVKARLLIFSDFEVESSHTRNQYPKVLGWKDSDIEDVEEGINAASRPLKSLRSFLHSASSLLGQTEESQERKASLVGQIYRQHAHLSTPELLALVQAEQNSRDSATDRTRRLARLLQKRQEVLDQKESRQLEQQNVRLLTQDIMALLGVTENELKFLESQERRNQKGARESLAHLQDLVQMVHRLPAHTKLEWRETLLTEMLGRGLRPGRGNLREGVVISRTTYEAIQRRVKFAAPQSYNAYLTQQEARRTSQSAENISRRLGIPSGQPPPRAIDQRKVHVFQLREGGRRLAIFREDRRLGKEMGSADLAFSQEEMLRKGSQPQILQLPADVDHELGDNDTFTRVQGGPRLGNRFLALESI